MENNHGPFLLDMTDNASQESGVRNGKKYPWFGIIRDNPMVVYETAAIAIVNLTVLAGVKGISLFMDKFTRSNLRDLDYLLYFGLALMAGGLAVWAGKLKEVANKRDYPIIDVNLFNERFKPGKQTDNGPDAGESSC